MVETVRATLAGMGWTDEPPNARGQTRDRWESWQALMDQAAEFEKAGGDLAGFVDDLDRRAAEQHAPVAEGVTLATFHAAKGLEWDAVFLCGLQDGTLPITYAETPAAVEEERRLLYVGMTRARHELCAVVVAGPPARRPGLPQAVPVPRPRCCPTPCSRPRRPRSARSKRGARTCRECGKPLSTGPEKKTGRCADCPASYDEELFERLREWRKGRADAEEVPAFVVFSDATLQLIAELKPTSTKALLGISGIGPQKLEKYGDDVLGLVS